MSQIVAAHQQLTDQEKTKILKEVLGSKFETAGDNLPLLKELMDDLDKIDKGFSAWELIPVFNKILELKVFSILAEGASILSIFFFPISALIDVINAYGTGARHYSYRAIAYSLTAWAFNDAPVHSSQTMLSNLRTGFPVPPDMKYTLKQYNEGWRKAETDAVLKIRNIAIHNKIAEASLKLFMRALAGNNRQHLCEGILRGFEKRLSFQDKITWRAMYSIKYPL